MRESQRKPTRRRTSASAGGKPRRVGLLRPVRGARALRRRRPSRRLRHRRAAASTATSASMTTSPTAPSRWSSPRRRTSPASIRGGLGAGRRPAVYLEYLDLLHDGVRRVRAEARAGGRIAVNVANLGRKPTGPCRPTSSTSCRTTWACSCGARSSGRRPRAPAATAPGARSKRPATRCCATSPSG